MNERKPKARYIVGIPYSTILYEGNSRFVAWLAVQLASGYSVRPPVLDYRSQLLVKG